MEWSDQGLVLSIHRHGETSAILHLLTRDHGRHAGLVRGGAGRRLRGTLQTGNKLRVTWRGRLAEHLGSYAVECDTAHAAHLLESPTALEALNSACALTLNLLPEREPHAALYEGLDMVLGALSREGVWPALYVRWEVGLLQELGFGLDLERCAVSGQRDDLTHVSPRTGRAVSRVQAEPYVDRLLRLPAFLTAAQAAQRESPGPEEILDGFRLTGYFLETRALAPQGQSLPPSRARLMARLFR